MEKRISEKVNKHQDDFKSSLKSWIDTCQEIDITKKSEFLRFIYDFDKLQLTKEDFCKRRRCKSIVPHYQRCLAKRACNEQCTRKRKDDSDYCGTHDKNRPHGVVNFDEKPGPSLKKVEVWLQEIGGINYYIDNNNNIYKTEDIISNVNNPLVIAKYSLVDGVYKYNN